MFSWYKYLIVNLVFPHLGFWSGNLFLIATLLDRCLPVPYYTLTMCLFVSIDYHLLPIHDISAMLYESIIQCNVLLPLFFIAQYQVWTIAVTISGWITTSIVLILALVYICRRRKQREREYHGFRAFRNHAMNKDCHNLHAQLY